MSAVSDFLGKTSATPAEAASRGSAVDSFLGRGQSTPVATEPTSDSPGFFQRVGDFASSAGKYIKDQANFAVDNPLEAAKNVGTGIISSEIGLYNTLDDKIHGRANDKTALQEGAEVGGVLLDLATFGIGGAIIKKGIQKTATAVAEKAAQKGIELSAEETAKIAAGQVVKKNVASSVAKTVGIGGAYGLDQGLQAGQTSAEDLLTSTATGGAVGLFLHGAGSAVGKFLKGKGASVAEENAVKAEQAATQKKINIPESDKPITVYNGTGNNRPGGAGNNLMGPGKYYSADEQVAKEFGDTITKAEVKPSEILKINNQSEYNHLLAETARTFEGDPLTNLPKYVASKGYKAIEGSAEAFGDEAGINIISKSDLKAALAHDVKIPKDTSVYGIEAAPEGDVIPGSGNAASPALGSDQIPKGESEFGFAKHANTSPDLSTDAQNALESVLGSSKKRNTKELADEAVALLKSDPGRARALAEQGGSDKSTAAAITLIKDYAAKGDAAKAAGDVAGARSAYDEMAKIAEIHTQNARSAGREVQANTLLASLSPEGQVAKVARQITRKAEEIASPEVVEKAAREISTVTTKESSAAAGEATSTTLKKLEKDVRTNGEKLATKVDNTLNPKPKQAVNDLVNELSKQVKDELLPAAEKKAPRDPLTIIKEVFAKTEESKAAYTEAQDILREKYKNDPKMLEALDNFSKSEFSRPNAASTTSRAVTQELRARETDLTSIIKKSVSSQNATVEQIAKEMTDKGFSKEAADTFAKEVVGNLTERVNARKLSALRTLQKSLEEKNPRAAKTIQDKIDKLSNTGALSDADYIDIAKRKLDLPELTGESAQKIHEYSQIMQDNPTGKEYAAARRGLEETISGAVGVEKPKGIRGAIDTVSGVTKSAGASFDNSFNFRQNLFTYFSHPVLAAKNLGKSFRILAKDLTSREGALGDVREYIYSSPNIHEYDKMGISPGIRNDIRPVNLEKIPLLGRAFRASEAAFSGTAELVRADLGDRFLKMADAAGIDKTQGNWYKSVGRFINTMTGNGDVRAPKLVSDVIWSPKTFVANIDKLTGDLRHYGTNHPQIRKEAALSSLRFIAGIAATMEIANILSPGSAELDPRSANFGKIKIGDTRFDITGGAASLVTLASRLLPTKGADGKYGLNSKSSVTGKLSNLQSGDYGSSTPLDVIQDFAMNKTSPLAATVIDVLRGTDRGGQPLTVTGELSNLGLPLPFRTASELLNAKNGANPLLGIIADGLGISTNTYDQGQSRPGIAGIKAQATQELVKGNPEAAQKIINDNYPIKDRKSAMTEAEKSASNFENTKPSQNVDFYKVYLPLNTEQSSVTSQAKNLKADGKADEAKQLVDAYNRSISTKLQPFTSTYGTGNVDTASKIRSLTIKPSDY